MGALLHEITEYLETLYPPHLAESWDKNGLILGDPHQRIERVLVAVDACEATAREAEQTGADLLLTHHPLLLRGAHFLPLTSTKGRTVATCVRREIALYNCHTNADRADRGVAASLAALLDLQEVDTLEPALEKGDGKLVGLGRIGRLPAPLSLRALATRLRELLPPTPAGILVGGPLEAPIERVALSPGAGDSFLSLARERGADVYICADLRHHPALDHLEEGRPYLINLTHWASEWPWVPQVAGALEEESALRVWGLEVMQSRLVTDPWTLRL